MDIRTPRTEIGTVMCLNTMRVQLKVRVMTLYKAGGRRKSVTLARLDRDLSLRD